MYFATFRHDGEERLGLAVPGEGRLLDLRRAQQALRRSGLDASGPELPAGMLPFIALEDAGVAEAARVEGMARAEPSRVPGCWFAEQEVRLCAPIPRPTKNVFAVGLNYYDHNAEFTGGEKPPEYPIFFSKTATSVIGPGEAIESHPHVTSRLDYEAELAVVIGRRGRDIPADRTESHIFGYTILNDVSARERQRRTSQWFIGKGLDTFCPMGPYILHRSALPAPVQVDVRCRVNGELRQDTNTRWFIFDIPTIIAILSEGMTLEPGDIIATGTGKGVGMGFDPPRFLRPGDTVEIEIERLGRLVNPVV